MSNFFSNLFTPGKEKQPEEQKARKSRRKQSKDDTFFQFQMEKDRKLEHLNSGNKKIDLSTIVSPRHKSLRYKISNNTTNSGELSTPDNRHNISSNILNTSAYEGGQLELFGGTHSIEQNLHFKHYKWEESKHINIIDQLLKNKINMNINMNDMKEGLIEESSNSLDFENRVLSADGTNPKELEIIKECVNYLKDYLTQIDIKNELADIQSWAYQSNVQELLKTEVEVTKSSLQEYIENLFKANNTIFDQGQQISHLKHEIKGLKGDKDQLLLELQDKNDKIIELKQNLKKFKGMVKEMKYMGQEEMNKLNKDKVKSKKENNKLSKMIEQAKKEMEIIMEEKRYLERVNIIKERTTIEEPPEENIILKYNISKRPSIFTLFRSRIYLKITAYLPSPSLLALKDTCHELFTQMEEESCIWKQLLNEQRVHYKQKIMIMDEEMQKVKDKDIHYIYLKEFTKDESYLRTLIDNYICKGKRPGLLLHKAIIDSRIFINPADAKYNKQTGGNNNNSMLGAWSKILKKITDDSGEEQSEPELLKAKTNIEGTPNKHITAYVGPGEIVNEENLTPESLSHHLSKQALKISRNRDEMNQWLHKLQYAFSSIYLSALKTAKEIKEYEKLKEFLTERVERLKHKLEQLRTERDDLVSHQASESKLKQELVKKIHSLDQDCLQSGIILLDYKKQNAIMNLELTKLRDENKNMAGHFEELKNNLVKELKSQRKAIKLLKYNNGNYEQIFANLKEFFEQIRNLLDRDQTPKNSKKLKLSHK